MSLWQSLGQARPWEFASLRDEACRQAGMIGGRRYPVLAVTAPKNDPREAALGNHLWTALGLRTRGRWSECKYLLFELLVQYGVECLICDDAHDLSMPHLIFLKELTDQLFLAFPSHPLGWCLVTAGRGASIPLKDVFDQEDDDVDAISQAIGWASPLLPGCQSYRGEVRDILLALEHVYRPSFPALNLQQWTGSLYTWLTHPLLDPQKSGRVLMDHLMKLVTTALQWSYAKAEQDVSPKHLEAAADQLTLRRKTYMWLMRNRRRRKTGARNRNLQKNQGSQIQRTKKEKNEAGKSALQRNQNLPIRNESELSGHCFWAEGSDKRLSAQFLRPNFQPIDHGVRKRRAGSFSSAQSTTCSTGKEIAGLRCEGGTGGALTCCCKMARAVGPVNGSCPVSMS